MTDLLTTAELQILDLLAEVHNAYMDLPEHHPSDKTEWVTDLHKLQIRVMSRAATRAYPDRFTPLYNSDPTATWPSR